MTKEIKEPAAEIRAELEKLAAETGSNVEYIVTNEDDVSERVTEQLEKLALAAFSLGAQTAMEWQKIESAPRDGTTRILCYLPPTDVTTFDPCVLSWGWDEDNERDAWIDYDDFAPDPQPIMWMPLPLPPAEAVQA